MASFATNHRDGFCRSTFLVDNFPRQSGSENSQFALEDFRFDFESSQINFAIFFPFGSENFPFDLEKRSGPIFLHSFNFLFCTSLIFS